MQIICISLQTDNHASTLHFYRLGVLPNQQRQSAEGKMMFICWFVNTSFKQCNTLCTSGFVYDVVLTCQSGAGFPEVILMTLEKCDCFAV